MSPIRHRAPFRWALAPLLAAAFVLGGCSLIGEIQQWFSGKLEVSVEIDDRLNRNSALPVDLVVVREKKLVDALLALDARSWFEQREQLARDNKRGFTRRSWEWVPGQRVPTQTVKIARGAETAIIFADYLSEGDHRQEVDPRQHFRLVLGEKSFVVLQDE